MRISLNNRDRNLFFKKVKENSGSCWKKIYIKSNTPKSSFEKYRSGKLLIPDKLFYYLIDKLSSLDKDYFISKLKKYEDNFGSIIGGKKAYIMNFNEFQRGRLLGMNSIQKNRDVETIDFTQICLNKNICELAGAFIGDGCFNCYKNKLYHIEFAGDRRYDMQYYKIVIIPTISSVIQEVNPHFYPSFDKLNAIRIVFYSKKLFLFLRDYLGFVPGKKTYNVSIPKKIILAKKEFLYSAIRGIFDTDGGVFLDRREIYKQVYPRIVFQTVSKNLYEQLYNILSKEFKMYTSFNPKRQVYIIEIYGNNQIKKWMSLIGFSNERHLKKINQLPQ